MLPILIFSLLHLTLSENWAVLVDSSKFYFNYRHTVNTLLIYKLLKRFNFDDDHIIIMLPENHQCHPRNVYPGKIFDSFHNEDLMEDSQIDYRGAEVTPENIARVLTGRHLKLTPGNKRIFSDEKSKIFLYLTGHGGDGYFKVQDTQVMLSADLANAVYEMNFKGKFEEMLIFIDSCKAISIFDYIDLPNVHGVSSSLRDQPAKSYGSNQELGISATDHFTYFFAQLFNGKNATGFPDLSIEKMINKLPSNLIKSQIGVKSKLRNYEIILQEYITDKRKGKPERMKSEFKDVKGVVWGKDNEDENESGAGEVAKLDGMLGGGLGAVLGIVAGFSGFTMVV